MVLPQTLQDFFKEQKARYGELFWHQTDGNKIILMIERLASVAREILAKENINGIEIVSFETDDSIGEFYVVEAEQIDVETRPGRQEYYSIMDKDLKSDFTDQTNDIYQNQIIRVFQPRGYEDFCVVVYHSFGKSSFASNATGALCAPPRGPIGWIKNTNGLRKLTGSRINELLNTRKEFLVSLEDVCKKLDGVKYQIGGGSKKNGFDCSSLVQRIFYETKGFWLPRKAKWQAMVCEKIILEDLPPHFNYLNKKLENDLNNPFQFIGNNGVIKTKCGGLQQGDLVFFNKKDDQTKNIDHVALVSEAQPGRLPVIFHAKRINSKAMLQDLNSVSWLDIWEINSFGRVPHL